MNIAKNAQIGKMRNLAQLGGYTEEILAAIKLVVSFGREEETFKIYEKAAAETMKVSKKAVFSAGAVGGSFMMLILGFFIFCLTVSSFFLQFGAVNPTTGKLYTLSDIIAVS